MSALRNRSTPSPPGPMLVPVGQHQGQPALPVSRHFTVVGSAPSARVYLPSKSVSRCHAAIINTGHGLFVRDLASRSGVRVNGRAVREADLRDGDVLQFGSYTFRFADPAPQPPPTPAVPVPAGALEVDGLDEPLPLDARTLLIGRRETADVSLTESSASSAHALIFESEGKHLLRDLSSRTGTFVNGVKVHEHPLSPGDVIRVGETSFAYARTGGATGDEREDDTEEVGEVPAESPAAPTASEAQAGAAGDFDFTPLDVAPADTPVPAPPSDDVGDVESEPEVSVGLVEHGETLRATAATAATAAQPAPQVPEVGDLTAPWEVDDAPPAGDAAPGPAADRAPNPPPEPRPDLMPALSEPSPSADSEPEKEPELELELAPSEEAPPPFAQTPIPPPESEPPAERKRVDAPPPKKESRPGKRASVEKPPLPPAAAKPPPPPAAPPKPAPPPARAPAPRAPVPRAPVPPTPAAHRPARPRSPFDVLGGADELEPLPETPQHPPPEPPAHEAHHGRTDE